MRLLLLLIALAAPINAADWHELAGVEAAPETIAPMEAPFDMLQLERPVFPNKNFDITNFDAEPGGEIKITQAINNAIAVCAEAGGGTVQVPAGIWLTGAIRLRSSVNLPLMQGAVLSISDDRKDYLPVVFTRWAGFECYNYPPLIYARDCLNIAVTGSGTAAPPPPVEIGAYRQLFVDDAMIRSAANVTYALHQPVKHSVDGVPAPVLPADKPWERYGVAVYGTTIYDEQEQVYKMWYRALSDSSYRSLVCYATSPDGINWTKPNLGRSSFEGSTDNNILDIGFYAVPSFGVIKDLNDPDPGRRYKMLCYVSKPKSFAAMVSPDGINWSGPINPQIHSTGDVISMYYDEGLGKYVGLTKGHVYERLRHGIPKAYRPVTPARARRHPQRRRARMITFSDDFVNWTEPTFIIAPDGQDSDSVHIYSHVAYEYEGMRLGYVSIYDTSTELIDSQLVSSRDGLSWDRSRERIAFIPNGAAGVFDSGSVYAGSSGLVADNENIMIYYTGWNVDHTHKRKVIGGGEPMYGIGLAKLRKDGFVSVDADAEGGTLTTVNFVLPGRNLLINAVTASSGGIRAELLDAEGNVIEGYGPADSSVFSGDSLAATVIWNGQPIAADLVGQAVSLRFHIAEGSLYSFYFN